MAMPDQHIVDDLDQECELAEMLRFLLNTPVRVVFATHQSIEFAILRYYLR